MRRILFLFLFVFLGNVSFAATPEEAQFAKGVEDFEAGKYQAAIDQWTALDTSGLKSFELYYNLGDAYFKKGDYPSAILYFEKALKVKPFDKEAKHNLNLANDQIVKRIKPLPDFFLKKVWYTMSRFLSANTWSWLVIILFWVGIGLIVARLFERKLGAFHRHYLVGGTLVGLSIFFLLLAVTKAKMETHSSWAIVLKNNMELMSAPESTVDVMELPEGTKLEIIDKIGDWEKVKAPNGEVGWISEKDAEKI